MYFVGSALKYDKGILADILQPIMGKGKGYLNPKP